MSFTHTHMMERVHLKAAQGQNHFALSPDDHPGTS